LGVITSVVDAQAFRDAMVSDAKSPKNVNGRIGSLSSFYEYLQVVPSEFRLPITVPNPAHAPFILPRDETKALSVTRARQLRGLPAGDLVLDYRDRAILKLSGARIGTGCGSRSRISTRTATRPPSPCTRRATTIGGSASFAAAQVITEYIEKAGLTRGPLFRARRYRRPELGERPIGGVTMYNLLQGYLPWLTGSMRVDELLGEDGAARKLTRCVYTPHSLRATSASLPLEAGVDILEVKELLGHRHATTTRIYDERPRSLKGDAPHDVPI
jgi:integrase